MNDLHHQQTSSEHDVRGTEAIERIRETVKKSPNCFFCTNITSSEYPRARPMNVRQVDDAGNLWFLSAKDSHLNAQIANDAAVALYFQGASHADFLELDGRAELNSEKRKIQELWEPILRTWFHEGMDDPRISVIKVVPVGGYYWDNKHGSFVASTKMVIGALFGATMDDSVHGHIIP